ncbi:unnamed protein product, partial [Ectocarpus sp. 12 AP-2014]
PRVASQRRTELHGRYDGVKWSLKLESSHSEIRRRQASRPTVGFPNRLTQCSRPSADTWDKIHEFALWSERNCRLRRKTIDSWTYKHVPPTAHVR